MLQRIRNVFAIVLYVAARRHVTGNRFLLTVLSVFLIFSGVIGFMVWPHTVYAPGFSEAAFTSIEIGDTTQQVLEQLGMPLDSSEYDGDIALYYSQPMPGLENYHYRAVLVGQNGRVHDKGAGTHFD